MIIFLSISLNICFGCSTREPSQWDGSFWYPQHMFWLRNKKKVNRPIVKSASKKLIFLVLNQNICFGCSKEPSHLDGPFEYPQHMLEIMGKKVFTIYAEIFCLSNLWFPQYMVWLRNKNGTHNIWFG